MSLDEDGLLSDYLHQYSAPIRQRHDALFDLLQRINRYCHACKYRIQVYNRDAREIAAVVLLIKLISDVQAAIFLLQYALVVQGRIFYGLGSKPSSCFATCASARIPTARLLWMQSESVCAW